MTANTPEAWSERADILEPWSAALWSEAGQVQRFLAALAHLDLREGDRLLDFGCGSGRFCEFLPQDVIYYAHDWAEGMRERVRRDYERAWVLDELAFDEYEHVVAIGTFNLAHGWSKDETWETLEGLWTDHDALTLAVALYRGNDPDCLSYEMGEVGAFAESLTNRFVIDCGYLDNDMMLVLRR